MVLVMLVTLAACQVPIEDRPPITISPAWDRFVRKDGHERSLVSPLGGGTKEQIATINRVLEIFMTKNGISRPRQKNIWIDVGIGNSVKSAGVTAKVADAKHHILPYISNDNLSKIQAIIICSAEDVGFVHFWYDSRDPIDTDFLYECLDDLFSRGAICTQ